MGSPMAVATHLLLRPLMQMEYHHSLQQQRVRHLQRDLAPQHLLPSLRVTLQRLFHLRHLLMMAEIQLPLT
jgi:hypothetical protein